MRRSQRVYAKVGFAMPYQSRRRRSAITQMTDDLRILDPPTAVAPHHLGRIARERRWDVAFMLLGWWHLVAFGACYYLTIAADYHGSIGYLLIWTGELAGAWLIFRSCGGPRGAAQPVGSLEQLVRRVWLAYLVLAFNLGSLNSLRGHRLFEFFPAIASLASFALIVMSVTVDRRFFVAVVVMFASGLLMAANLLHAYLIFALAWWAILNGIGIALFLRRE